MGARSRDRVSCGLLAVAFGLLAAGCHSSDLVEAELRTRENDVREMKAEIGRLEAQNEALVRELHAVRQGAPATAVTPELASQTYTLRQIVLGRGTGGYDDDDCPGDEALQVVLEPRDSDGHTIKAPGSLHVEALEINPEGIKTPVSAWDLSPDQLRRTWRSGLLSTGYFIVLPWKNWPNSEKIRVVARFTLSDGRVFEADKDITIRLIPVMRRKPLPAAEQGDLRTPPPAGKGEVLPVPRKVESTSLLPARNWWQQPPNDSAAVQTSLWRPKPEYSVLESVKLLRPTPLTTEPCAE
jgi:hypothetical protein